MEKVIASFEFDGQVFRFRFGNENELESRKTANECYQFTPDDEDEQIDDFPTSCYNCMNRRWLIDGMACSKIERI
ncbi:hypothetical protein [Shewanella woodyi]|uniref:Uncharacterized protein n=1 Tax=Shewanella woodyi (strain ATCC 51908 / MS32) TaxID=392500 RepID=B1KL59_SHEWM|nr:hypothetical protein [Shewanella woodyi]ACA84400.1 conserved hypothetical protein [Shewanella woodyi ATCC 51908]